MKADIAALQAEARRALHDPITRDAFRLIDLYLVHVVRPQGTGGEWPITAMANRFVSGAQEIVTEPDPHQS